MHKKVRHVFRQMSSYLSASMSVHESLQMIHKRIRKRDKVFLGLVTRIQTAIQEGASIAKAFEVLHTKRLIDSVSFSILKSSERSGNLRDGFAKISVYLEQKARKKGEFLGQALYPVIVAFSSVLLVYLLVLFIFPKIIPLFTAMKAPIPKSTVVILGAVTFVSKNILVLCIVIFCICYLAGVFYKRYEKCRTGLHRVLIGTPFFGGILFAKDSAQMCNSAAVLLKSGISITEAVSISRQDLFAEPYKKVFAVVEEKLGIGKTVSTILQNEPYFKNSDWPDFMLVGERSGVLPQAFEDLGKVYEREFESKLAVLGKCCEPLLLLCVAGVVLFVALSVIQPMYSIIQYVNP